MRNDTYVIIYWSSDHLDYFNIKSESMNSFNVGIRASSTLINIFVYLPACNRCVTNYVPKTMKKHDEMFGPAFPGV